MSEIAYETLCEDPGAYAEANLVYRGEVGAIEHQNGLPCLLFFTRSLGRGEWADPVYVVCPEILSIAAGDRPTLYVHVTGETREYRDETGNTRRIPVVRLAFWSE